MTLGEKFLLLNNKQFSYHLNFSVTSSLILCPS